MAYTAVFDSSESYVAASQALRDDLKSIGLTESASIHFDESKNEIHFDMNAIELGILFGNKERSKSATHLPFSLGNYPPTEEAFKETAKECHIEGVRIVRDDGDFLEGYRSARQAAKQILSGVPEALPLTSSPHLDNAVASAMHDGALVVGEAHGNQAHLKFLSETLPKIAEQKKSVLLLEHFFQDQQPLLDAYMASPKGAPMPAELAVYVDRYIDPKINGASLNSPYSTHKLLELCKETGVRPVGIETEYSFSSLSLHAAQIADNPGLQKNLFDIEALTDSPQARQKSMKDRLLIMNANAAGVWKDLAANPDSEPFPIVLAGANHVVDFSPPHQLPENNIPGLGRIFQTSPIFIMDEKTPLELRQAAIATVESTGTPPEWLSRIEETIRNARSFIIDKDGHDAPVSPPLISARPQQLAGQRLKMPDGR